MGHLTVKIDILCDREVPSSCTADDSIGDDGDSLRELVRG